MSIGVPGAILEDQLASMFDTRPFACQAPTLQPMTAYLGTSGEIGVELKFQG
jgi:hypothetical protein